MYFIAVACMANAGLDYLFAGVLHIGPADAALGTMLSQAISVTVSPVVILKRRTGISVSRSDLMPQRSVMSRILKTGVPIAFQDGLIQIAFIIITVIANHRGLNDSAAVSIVEKLMGFLFLIPSTLLSAVSALGAQNLGAGKPERAVAALRYFVMLALGYGIAAALLMQFIAEPVVSLFTDAGTEDGAQIVRLDGQYLRGYVWDCIFAGVRFCFSGYFCAVGRSEISFIHNLSAILLMRIPGVYLTSRLFPETLFPMGLATAFGSLISVIICVIAFAAIDKPPLRRQKICRSGFYSLTSESLTGLCGISLSMGTILSLRSMKYFRTRACDMRKCLFPVFFGRFVLIFFTNVPLLQ